MNFRKKYMIATLGFGVMCSLATINPAFAHGGIPDPGPPTPITFSGTITDHGVPVPDLVVVAWCGGLDNFGGSSNTDSHGWFEIHTTNGFDCPLGAHGFLEIFHAGEAVGFAFRNMTVHTLTTVNVKLEDSHPTSVPEFGWLAEVAAAAVGVGAVVFARRHYSGRIAL